MSAKQIVLQKPVLKRASNFVESPKTTLSLIHPSELENEKKTENVEQNEKIWDELVSCIKYSPVDYSYNILNNPSPDALTNEELTKLANGDFVNADFLDIVYSPIHQIDKITFPFPFQFQNENILKK
jgi:hypothetical protein